MTPETLSYSSAFLLGLLSATHCVGMCGGLTGAFNFSLPAPLRKPLHLLWMNMLYNIGRILTYMLIAFVFGSIAQLLQNFIPTWVFISRFFAGILLIIMGLYLAQIWHGLSYIEKWGYQFWKKCQPSIAFCFPPNSPIKALGFGMFWGALPCGLVYSVLLWSVTSGSAFQSSMIMLCFGLGSMPALITIGLFSNTLKKWMQLLWVRRGSGIFIILVGIWTLWMPIPHAQHTEHPSTTEHHH